VIEVPILNEYTWRGAGERSEEFIALAKQDVERIVQESPVAVMLMHTHGIQMVGSKSLTSPLPPHWIFEPRKHRATTYLHAGKLSVLSPPT